MIECKIDMLEPSDEEEMTECATFFQRHSNVKFTCLGDSKHCGQSGEYTWQVIGLETDIQSLLNDIGLRFDDLEE